ncbi:SDR family oxidoreductase [Deinococcus soli (ex Cha et al. 2016)]|jgi:NAD(P)H dehydrogenase (quinone)|uniref:Quinone oxidoreductase n=1 Tax=Deinococcus soli (ex Cha et al. 2016) TaxID=1309411 RepID=A0A0F7JKL9_9DEIO|nr:SDR family oxidoreductase [Deinococcus soli (ex Cha et al. 2016)]AKH15854.1 quinone oxidoreductase [Deinococcus soli (ex Cha et al. 2016)]GGB56711.1 NAD(P)-dependent oxidoreductase [Deinococcus soli (ex Cha et al. 2016)]
MTTTPARTIAVTGATGHLGRLTLQALIKRGVPAGNLVALVRDPAKAADLAAQGIQVRQADYRQPDTLSAALNGVNRLLLISSNDFDDRVGQHRHVIDAARNAGVDLIAYTSLLNADRSGMILAGDHQATEALLRESGVPFTLLRNGWYTENYDLKGAVKNGAILGAAGNHALQPAPRQDYAEAAAAVLSTDGHAGQTYELAGDEAITLADLAAEVARQSGQPVAYHDLSAEEYARTLAGFGVPDGFAQVLADSDTGITRGELASESRDLSRLIGRPTTPTTQAVRDALTA